MNINNEILFDFISYLHLKKYFTCIKGVCKVNLEFESIIVSPIIQKIKIQVALTHLHIYVSRPASQWDCRTTNAIHMYKDWLFTP